MRLTDAAASMEDFNNIACLAINLNGKRNAVWVDRHEEAEVVAAKLEKLAEWIRRQL